MTLLHKSFLSLLASAYLLSTTGCLDDRTSFKKNALADRGEKQGFPIDKPNPTPNDTDGDGLSNYKEKDIGTDPNNVDSDNDRLSDGQEYYATKTDPKNADTDADGLSDGEETKLTTDPKKADTDGDGINDGDETKLGTNPLKKDSDNDGVSDAQEIRGAITKDENRKNEIGDSYNINNPANTRHDDKPDVIDALDPMNDSDNDARPNFTETQKATDPLDPSSNYPWIYETAQGIVMENAGFAYIPAIDARGGFWISKHEAKKTDEDIALNIEDLGKFVNSHFDLLSDGNVTGYSRVNDSGIPLKKINFAADGALMLGMYAFEAAYILEHSQIAKGAAITLPSLEQYEHIAKLTDANAGEIKNNVLFMDGQVPSSYKVTGLNSIRNSVDEFTKTIVLLDGFAKPSWLKSAVLKPRNDRGAIAGSANDEGRIGANDRYAVAIKGTSDDNRDVIDLLYSVSYGDSKNIGFRAASTYIK